MNQIVPSDFVIRSFGEFNFLPSYLLEIILTSPYLLVLLIALLPCSAEMRFPSKSVEFPLEKLEGYLNTPVELSFVS